MKDFTFRVKFSGGEVDANSKSIPNSAKLVFDCKGDVHKVNRVLTALYNIIDEVKE